MRLESFLADELFAASVVPIACPSVFGQGDRYELIEMIAHGQRSWVYHARDRRFGNTADVAIKLFRQGTKSDEGLLGRQVRHTNIIHVLDRGTDPASGLEYVVTDYAAKGTLADTPVPAEPRRAVAVALSLTRAVNAAHQAGIVHCDIKPHNVLVDQHGVYKLADFELAHQVSTSIISPGSGTPAFMAPEQWRSDSFSAAPAADVYALGGLLYWLLSGRYPNGNSRAEAEALATGKAARKPPAVHPTLRRIVDKALAVQVSDRYTSADALAADLEAWLNHQPIAWQRPSPWHRAGLYLKRRPYTAASLAVLLISLLAAGTAILKVHNARLEADVRAQVQSEALANEKFTKKEAAVRKEIAADNPELANLYYDRNMTTKSLFAMLDPDISKKDVEKVVEEWELSEVRDRAEQLTAALAEAQRLGHAGDLYYLHMRICLASDQLMLGQDDEVREHVNTVRAQLLPLVKADDPLHTALQLLERATTLRAGHMEAAEDIGQTDRNQLRPTGSYFNVRRAVWHRIHHPLKDRT